MENVVKNKRLALIKPPMTYCNWYNRPVLGLTYVSAYLEQNGFDCKIFDAYFKNWSLPELVNNIIAYNPDFIGVTSMTHEIVSAANVASAIKKSLDVPVVVGGCHATALPDRTLAEFPVFDYAIYGEGEKTALELLEYLSNRNSKSDLASIRGLAFRNRDNIVVNEPRPFLASEELDKLPYPAFHQYYGDNSKTLTGKDKYYVMLTSRGCPYNCAFCMQVLGRKVRLRSAESVCQEIEYAIFRYGAHTINFEDELFLTNTQRTRQILNMLIDSGLSKRIRWSALTRVNMVDKDMLSLAKRAGCFRLHMGVESGDDDTLKAIGKGITVEQVRNAVDLVKDAGIESGTYFIIGHPNETRRTAQKTIDLAAELNTKTIAVGIMVPYPGTRVYDMAKRGENGYRLLSEDWAQYDKYGGRTLEVKGLSYEEMVKLQKRAYINLYLKNIRLLDFAKFIWQRRHALRYFLAKRLRTLCKSQ
jgi:anaerobic magnesium-protoporphyrin IX monomethyl ester cyclase